jgi:hypothetical protein
MKQNQRIELMLSCNNDSLLISISYPRIEHLILVEF